MNTASSLEGTPSAGMTIVEIGCGGAGFVLSSRIPEVDQYYAQGGEYIAIDPSQAALDAAQSMARALAGRRKQEGAVCTTTFVSDCIAEGRAYPNVLQPNKADRVVIGDVFTYHLVAPATRSAIARCAFDIVRKDPAGEAIVVATNNPGHFSEGRTGALMTSHGFSYIGPDDPGLYGPRGMHNGRNQDAFVMRFAPQK